MDERENHQLMRSTTGMWEVGPCQERLPISNLHSGMTVRCQKSPGASSRTSSTLSNDCCEGQLSSMGKSAEKGCDLNRWMQRQQCEVSSQIDKTEPDTVSQIESKPSQLGKFHLSHQTRCPELISAPNTQGRGAKPHPKSQADCGHAIRPYCQSVRMNQIPEWCIGADRIKWITGDQCQSGQFRFE